LVFDSVPGLGIGPVSFPGPGSIPGLVLGLFKEAIYDLRDDEKGNRFPFLPLLPVLLPNQSYSLAYSVLLQIWFLAPILFPVWLPV